MTFGDAVRTCLQHKYADFSGRAARAECWWFILFTILVGIVAGIIDGLAGTVYGPNIGVVGTITSLALLLPSLAVGARRLHDTSRSGWWLLLLLIPFVGVIIVLVLFLFDSQDDNQYGPRPSPAAQPAT
jgi:uncharacterized membrane protein YhaH (DUF805 family)